MLLFADENTPGAIVRWLRNAGHDVTSASELHPGEDDEVWLCRAEAEGRLIVTSDKDFGELVFRDGLNTYGVLLLRLEGLPMKARVARLDAVWGVIEANDRGAFVVITEHKVRVRRARKHRSVE